MQERCDHTPPTGGLKVDEVSKAASAVRHENKPAKCFFWLNLTKIQGLKEQISRMRMI